MVFNNNFCTFRHFLRLFSINFVVVTTLLNYEQDNMFLFELLTHFSFYVQRRIKYKKLLVVRRLSFKL